MIEEPFWWAEWNWKLYLQQKGSVHEGGNTKKNLFRGPSSHAEKKLSVDGKMRPTRPCFLCTTRDKNGKNIRICGSNNSVQFGFMAIPEKTGYYMNEVHRGGCQITTRMKWHSFLSCILKGWISISRMAGSSGDQELFVVYFRKKPLMLWSSGLLANWNIGSSESPSWSVCVSFKVHPLSHMSLHHIQHQPTPTPLR